MPTFGAFATSCERAVLAALGDTASRRREQFWSLVASRIARSFVPTCQTEDTFFFSLILTGASSATGKLATTGNEKRASTGVGRDRTSRGRHRAGACAGRLARARAVRDSRRRKAKSLGAPVRELTLETWATAFRSSSPPAASYGVSPSSRAPDSRSSGPPMRRATLSVRASRTCQGARGSSKLRLHSARGAADRNGRRHFEKKTPNCKI